MKDAASRRTAPKFMQDMGVRLLPLTDCPPGSRCCGDAVETLLHLALSDLTWFPAGPYKQEISILILKLALGA
jgi:hypothetical protein